MTKSNENKRIAVVGGGIAGLTAAAFLGRAGQPVTLFESSSEPGGRAGTQELSGFCFNFGAHALYKLGAARRALLDLGIEVPGSPPPSKGLFAVLDGRLHLLPMGPMTLLRTDLLTIPEKLQVAGLLSKLPKKGGEGWHGRSAREWIHETTESETLRLLLAGLFRLSAYANDLDRQDAGAFLDQLRLAIRANVVYVHDGWKTLVKGLAATIEAAGGQIRLGTRVEALIGDGDPGAANASALRLSDGEVVEATDIVLAVTPAVASGLAGPLGAQIPEPRDLRPVRAACLDLGLSKLPRPDRLFALGLDRPTYLSVHSSSARLAPKGKALVHLLWYLGAETPSRDEVSRELEEMMDLVQPGWREVVEERRLMPEMVVTHALVQAEDARPAVDSSGVERVWLAGDWLGEEGMLADAAAASGRLVAEQILEAGTRPRASGCDNL